MSAVDNRSILARYRIESCLPLEQVAETIAGEQSSGTFLPVPGETEELKSRSRAKVTNITLLDSVDAPSLQGGRKPKGASGPFKYQRAEITLAFPIDNLGANLPTLVATVCGNLYELSDHTGCKLLDLELPPAFGEKYPGPQFSGFDNLLASLDTGGQETSLLQLTCHRINDLTGSAKVDLS